MSIAFVLPGGSNLGAIQIGMLKVLAEEGIEPDLLVGTSIGAVNASYLGFHGGLAGLGDLEQVWLKTTRRQAFPLRPDVIALGLIGRRHNLVPSSAVVRFMRPLLGDRRIEEASPRVAIVTTDSGSGEAVVLTEGPALAAVVASSAIPGMFSPVELGGRWLVDGSVSADMGLLQAQALGATTIYALSTRPPTTGRPPPKGTLAMLMRAAALLEDRIIADDLAALRSDTTVHVIPPPFLGVDLLPYDFRRTAELIERGYEAARAWFEGSQPPSEPMVPPEPMAPPEPIGGSAPMVAPIVVLGEALEAKSPDPTASSDA